MRLNIVIGLLGLIAGLLIAMVAGSAERPVYAQGAAADGSMFAVAANFNNQQEDVVYVFDAKTKRLSCYKYKNNMVEFIGARNIKFDLQVDDFIYQGKHLKPRDIERLLNERKPKEPKKTP